MNEEWGPWIEHDGAGCPCVGMWVQTERIGTTSNWIGGGKVIHRNGKKAICEGRATDNPNWYWAEFGGVHPDGGLVSKILRYRIRKPRGLTILEELLVNLPERVDA